MGKVKLSKQQVKVWNLNDIWEHYIEPIIYDGELVGYRLYASGGLLGTLRFNKYIWL